VASAHLELVRSIFAAWERGDFGSVEWADPEIEYVIADGPAPGTWKGLKEVAAAERLFLSGLAEFRAEADELRELDDERILVLTHALGRGKTSGLDLSRMRAHGAALFHISDDKVTKLVVYWDRANALAEVEAGEAGGS
jgi:ketosteroid isomerase-like protein